MVMPAFLMKKGYLPYFRVLQGEARDTSDMPENLFCH